MIKRINKKYTIIIAALLMFLSMSVAFVLINAVASGVSYKYIGEIKQTYEKEEVFTVPEGIVTVDGKEYIMDSHVEYPDGRKSFYDKIVLDAMGNYTIEYTSEIAGKQYGEVKQFSVGLGYKSVFTTEKGIEGVGYVELSKDIANEDYSGGIRYGVGISATESEAETYYNGVVKTDAKMGHPVISFQVTPNEIGKVECSYVYITLTDIYDENNYLELRLMEGGRWGMPHASLLSARACGMGDWIGYSPFSETYNNHGAYQLQTFAGNVKGQTNSPIEIYYDCGDRMIYYSRPGNVMLHLIDLDNASIVGVDNVWGGFTTDEVYLSIRMGDITEKSANLTVLSIDGVTFDADYFDTNETNIYIDYDGAQAGALPEGVQGAFYPVFKSYAVNSRAGILAQPTVKVVYKGQNGDENVPIIDNKFPTERAGKYRLIYSVDYNGTIVKTVDVRVSEQGGLFDYEINENIPDAVKVGDSVNIFDGTVICDSGDAKVQYTVKCGNKDIAISQDSYYPSFIVDSIGEYVLTVTVEDVFGRIINKTKTIYVNEIATPIIEKPSFPECVMKNVPVLLSVPAAVYYDADGLHDVDVKLFINGEDYTGVKYTPIDDFTVKYVATVKNKPSIVSEETYLVKIRQAGGANDFFNGYFLSSDVDSDGIDDIQIYNGPDDSNNLFFETSIDGASFAFCNPVYVDTSSLISFALDAENHACSSFNIYMTDRNDSRISVKVSFKSEMLMGIQCRNLYINDIYQKTYIFENGFDHEYSIAVNDKEGCLTDVFGEKIADIPTVQNGNEFKGFASGEYYLRFEFEGLTDTTIAKIATIGNQKFSSLFKFDKTKPVAVFKENVPMVALYQLGASVNFPELFAYDVLNGIKNISLTITSPEGATVYTQSTTDSVFPETEINLTEYGQYTVAYILEDRVGNKLEVYRYVRIIDTEAPSISVNGGIAKTAAVGDSITLPNATVTDNVDTSVKCLLTVLEPNGCTYLLKGKNYIFETAGVYRFRYVSEDENGNIAIVEFVTVVK